MSSKLLQTEIAEGVATLTLDDPGALNALSTPMLESLVAALDAIEAPESGVRCVLLTGAGRAFCAGANLTGDPGDMLDAEGRLDVGKPLDSLYHPILLRLADLHCPLVTAVNGAAAGAGMSLAMLGDLVLAARSATFLQAFRHRGLIPDCGSTFLLPRRVGWARAVELSMLGEKLPAERALDWGLINRVYDDDELMPEARRLVAELAAGPTVALKLIRRAYRESAGNDLAAQLEVERELQRQAGLTSDFVEGVAAFRQKRPPRFEGR